MDSGKMKQPTPPGSGRRVAGGRDDPMEYSIVVPLYNEEDNLDILYREIRDVMEGIGGRYEVIFVDDGSTDETYPRLCRIAESDPSVVVIRFRRNFGQSAAMSAGFEHASGQVVVSLDGDLQNDPSDIPVLIEKLKEGYDVVSGWRKNRRDKMLVRKIPSRLANKVICHVTGVKLHDSGCSLKAYRKEILKSISLYGELHRFIPALARMQGAEISELAVNHRERRYGKSKYNLTRTFKVLMDISTLNLFLKYLDRPQIYFGSTGFTLMIVGFLSLLWFVYARIAGGGDPAEGNVLITLNFLLIVTGFQFILYGLLSRLIVQTGHRSRHKGRIRGRGLPFKEKRVT